MPMLPHEVFKKMSSAKTKADKVKILKENESWGLKDIIRGAMDSNVKWLLPAGKPPYTPAGSSPPTNILRENKKFGYFANTPQARRMKAYKREGVFIGLLEGIHPEDAEILIQMINKEVPEPLTRPIVEAAFPGLLTD